VAFSYLNIITNYYYNYYIRLTAFFQDNPLKEVEYNYEVK